MSVTNIANVCNALIVKLNPDTGSIPTSVVQSAGFYSALNSPQNTQGYTALKDQVRNELATKDIPNDTFPKIVVTYEKPHCTDTSVDAPTSPCTYGSTTGAKYGSLDVKVEGYKEVEFTLTNAQFEQVCYGKDEFMAIEMRQKAYELLQDVNADLGVRVQSLMGNYTDGTSSLTSPRTLNILNSSLAPNPMIFPLLRAEYNRMGKNKGIMKVGGEYLGLYNDALAISVANTYTGLDATKIPMLDYYYDTTIDALNPDGCTLLTWGAGAIQMLEAYRYEGTKSWIMDMSVRRTMAVDGFEFDYSMEFDPCTSGGKWVIKLSKSYDLFYVPENDFTCTKGGGNFKLQYLLGCGAVSCNDLNFCPVS